MATNRILGALVTLAALYPFAAPAQAQEPARKSKPLTFDPSADARAAIGEAEKLARRDHQRVLLVFGTETCERSLQLSALLQSDKAIRDVLRTEYRVVRVDVGDGSRNEDISEGFRVPLREHGTPILTVLTAGGTAIHHSTNRHVSTEDTFDTAKILAILQAQKATLPVADKVLEAAMAEAQKSERRVLLHFGAPWCGWCHRLEDFLAIPEIAAVIAKDYVDVKIDEDRMVGGKELEARIRKERKGGIPWLVVAEPDLVELATSDAAAGNIGYPVSESEIAHFMTMIGSTRQRITDEEMALLRTTLESRGREIQEAQERARREAEKRRKGTERR